MKRILKVTLFFFVGLFVLVGCVPAKKEKQTFVITEWEQTSDSISFKYKMTNVSQEAITFIISSDATVVFKEELNVTESEQTYQRDGIEAGKSYVLDILHQNKIIYTKSFTSRPVIHLPEEALKFDITTITEALLKEEILQHIEVKDASVIKVNPAKISIDLSKVNFDEVGIYEVIVTYQFAAEEAIEKKLNIELELRNKITVSLIKSLTFVQGASIQKKDLLSFFSIKNSNGSTIDMKEDMIDLTDIDFNTVGEYQLTISIPTEKVKEVFRVTIERLPDPTIVEKKELSFEKGITLTKKDLISYFTITNHDGTQIAVTEDMIDISNIDFHAVGDYKLIFLLPLTTGELLRKEFSVTVKLVPDPTISVIKELLFEQGQSMTAKNLVSYFSIVDYKGVSIVVTESMININDINFNEPGEYQLMIALTLTTGELFQKEFAVTIVAIPDPNITVVKDLIFEERQQITAKHLISYFSIINHKGVSVAVTDSMINISSVKFNEPGEYQLFFILQLSYGKTIQKEFAVIVTKIVDVTPPVITVIKPLLFSLNETKTLEELCSYFKITDQYDGDILVTPELFTMDEIDYSKEGSYLIYITVEDAAGNAITQEFTLVVQTVNTTKPIDRIDKIDPNYMPSTGDVNVLVIPINMTKNAGDATESKRETIRTGFFGTAEQTGWESVSSYYKKSSYGKLNISGTITNWYTPKKSQNDYAKYEDNNNYLLGSTLLMDEALTALKGQYDYRDYDANNDGCIDAVYLIYNCAIGGNGTQVQEDFYWAYVYWDFTERNYNSVDSYSYMFAGYDFFEEKMRYGSTPIHNAETFIHETGHLMGLDDYYDYSDGSNSNLKGGYGGADMMDWNIGDHNPYSKSLLGWVDPIVVNQSMTIQLQSFTETGQYLVVPYTKFDTLFTNYFIVEFYTLTGLNQHAMTEFFQTNKKALGVRISEVNAELAKDSDGYWMFKYSTSDNQSKQKQLRWLEADYNNETRLGINSSGDQATVSDFFTPTSKQFGMNHYQTFKSYSNKNIPFTMLVDEMTDTTVTVTITRK